MMKIMCGKAARFGLIMRDLNSMHEIIVSIFIDFIVNKKKVRKINRHDKRLEVETVGHMS
jgi:hypothetical protein